VENSFRIRSGQKPTTTSGQRMSTQEEPTRNVHFSVPSQSSSVPPNFNMPQQNVGQTQHQPHPVQRQPSIPQPGAQTTGLNPNEEKALRDLMSKAGLGMPGQSYGTRPLQNSGYSQGYLPYPQAPFVQPLYQPTQGYGQGFLPYQQAPIAQPHYLPPPGYGFNQLPVSQHQNMGTTNSFQDVSLSEAGQLRYDGRGMPKFEIENFKGDRLDYPRFKNTFMSIIGNRQIYAEEKALRLVNLLEGEPRKLIAGVLEGHIGQHTHAMIWDIPIKNTSVEELKRFYILLTEIKSFFLTHNPTVLQHEFSTELGLVKQLVQERHLNLYMDWYQNLRLLDNLDTFVNWVGHLLTVRQHAQEEASKPSRGAQNSTPKRFGRTTLQMEEVVDEDFQDCNEEAENETEAEVVFFSKNSSSKQSDFRQNKKSEGTFQTPRKCDFCKLDNHNLVECKNFRKEDYSKRNDWILTNGFCYHCLNKGHTSKQCTLFPNRTCGMNGCNRRHHRLLHPPDGSIHYCLDELDQPEESETKISQTSSCVTSTSAATIGKRHFVGVRTIPVWACNGKRRRLVVAALDACADNTNISTELAEELKLDVIHGSVNRFINYMDRTVAVKSSLVKFEIEPYQGGKTFPIEAWKVDSLIQNTKVVDWVEVSQKFGHLRDLPIPPLPKKNAKVDILLGCEYARLMASTEAALGPEDDDPVAEKTALGWACSGPIPGCVVKSKFNSYVQTSLRTSSVSARFYQGYLGDQHENEDLCNLEKLIERQWEVESLVMSEPTPKLTNKMRKTCSKPTPDEWTEKEKLADQRMEVVYLEDEKA